MKNYSPESTSNDFPFVSTPKIIVAINPIKDNTTRYVNPRAIVGKIANVNIPNKAPILLIVVPKP